MMFSQFAVAAAAVSGLLLGAPAAAAAGFKSDRIVVTAEGSGPDVILIPGMTSSPSAWKATNTTIPGYRYHYVQVKGFAGTPPEANADGEVAAPVAREIARYIAEKKLKRPAVIGHSMGGTMAMMLAARHPGSVAKIMVVDQLPFMGAVLGPPGATAESLRPMADKFRAQSLAAPVEAGRKRLEEMSQAMVANETHRAVVIREAKASDRKTVANSFHELTVTDLRPELAKIDVPATVLYVTPAGVPLTDAQVDGFYKASYATLKGVKLVRIPDSAHFIMSDNPERYKAEMKAFLER